MSIQQKLCVDCKHYAPPSNLHATPAMCGLVRELVHGGPAHSCVSMRTPGALCGSAGKEWQPVEHTWALRWLRTL